MVIGMQKYDRKLHMKLILALSSWANKIIHLTSFDIVKSKGALHPSGLGKGTSIFTLVYFFEEG